MSFKYFFLILILTLSSCSATREFSFLEGVWKVEGKENYEAWSKTKKGLSGIGYRIRDGKKIITENLAIVSRNGNLFYEATVPDQNEGKTVSFRFNAKKEHVYSFENPDHDFPRVIRYRKLNNARLFVEVLGANNQGFSFYMSKQ